MHRHLLVRDGLKDAEYKLREKTRKLQETIAMHEIELERNEIISKRGEQTVKLTDTLEIPIDLDEKLEEETKKLETTKQKLATLAE